METYKERLRYFIEDYLHTTINNFAEHVGIYPQTLYKTLDSGKEPSLKVTSAILEKYPDFNIEWLLSGKGLIMRNKLVSSGVEDDETNKLHYKNEQETKDCSKWIAEIDRLKEENQRINEELDTYRDYVKLLKEKRKK